MKYYSEVLRKAFDTEKECVYAEKEHNEKVKAEEERVKALNNARKDRAKEVEDAYKAMIDAQHRYTELVNKFVKDYDSWHMTISSPIEELADVLLRFI